MICGLQKCKLSSSKPNSYVRQKKLSYCERYMLLIFIYFFFSHNFSTAKEWVISNFNAFFFVTHSLLGLRV
jgi:hypothetical protein